MFRDFWTYKRDQSVTTPLPLGGGGVGKRDRLTVTNLRKKFQDKLITDPTDQPADFR